MPSPELTECLQLCDLLPPVSDQNHFSLRYGELGQGVLGIGFAVPGTRSGAAPPVRVDGRPRPGTLRRVGRP
jgi:hypothetical protein